MEFEAGSSNMHSPENKLKFKESNHEEEGGDRQPEKSSQSTNFEREAENSVA